MTGTGWALVRIPAVAANRDHQVPSSLESTGLRSQPFRGVDKYTEPCRPSGPLSMSYVRYKDGLEKGHGIAVNGFDLVSLAESNACGPVAFLHIGL